MSEERKKEEKSPVRSAFAMAGVMGGAVIAAAVIALNPVSDPVTYKEVAVKCSAPELTQTFRNATVSGREIFPQWPAARPITVQERDTGRTTSFSGNNCVVLPKNS